MKFALLGHPLGHSLSPQLHAFLAGLKGIELFYSLVDLPPDELAARLPGLLAELDGLNVTIPYKQAVAGHLQALDETAARYGAVNTVRCGEGGAVGYNTDCTGFVRALEEVLPGVRTAFVIGAGGVGRMFAIELARRGASVVLGVRPSSLQKARALAAELRGTYGATARVVLISDLSGEEDTYDLLINATPCGMAPHSDGCPAPKGLVRRSSFIFDSIYNPARTRLMKLCSRYGKPSMGGMRMLAWQGAAAQEIWYGARFTPDEIAKAEAYLYGLLPVAPAAEK